MKKPAPWVINLKHIPLELKAPAEEPQRELPKPSPAPTQYPKPSYMVNPAPSSTAPTYNSYNTSSDAFQAIAPPTSVPATKYAPSSHPITTMSSGMPSMSHDSRPVMHGMEMGHRQPGYDMMYYHTAPNQTHMSAYYNSPYGVYGQPTAPKRTPQQQQ
jgi:hypothetical protein